MSHVVVLVDDLLFLSRIREAARGVGAEIRTARNAKALLDAVRAGGRLVLVDADSARLPWDDAVRALRAEAAGAVVPVIAFLSHVQVARAAAARDAGCTRVLARSAFVRELPGLLAAAAPPAPALEENER